MSKPWGGVGAWALDAEREEAEEREREAAAGDLAQSFPCLKDSSAASASSKQKKKKKRAAVPLAQFVATGGSGGAESSKGLTNDEMVRLPTGPRERSQDELVHVRLGGGFRTFSAGERNGSLGGGRRGYNGFDDRRSGPPPRDGDLDLPSRADKVESWEAGKKAFVPQRGDGGRRDPYGFGDGSSSMVDGVDNWAATMKPCWIQSSSFGSEFMDPRASSDSNQWVRDREGSMPIEQGRRKLVLDPPKKRDADAPPPPREPAKTRPSPFGAARPREEVLAEKGVDWKQVDSENEMKNSSRPTSSHSSRPSSSQSSKQESMSLEEVVAKPRCRVNPFGNVKPREAVLVEKGIDLRKVELDLQHRKVERYEINEERFLKEEIDHLKSMTIETDEASNPYAKELSMLQKEIASKENDLEPMAHQLDDSVQFNQRQTMNNSRPGSAVGRSETSSTRPPSQSGMSEGYRSTEFVDRPHTRPRSRGAIGDECGKTANSRRGFWRGDDKGFFHGRNSDRSSSREPW